MVWKDSGWSGKFPDGLESFKMVWKVSGWSRNDNDVYVAKKIYALFDAFVGKTIYALRPASFCA